MSVVVSYLPSPEGEAAISRAADEARDGGGPLIVVPSRGHRDELNAALERVRAAGVQAEVAEPDGDDITDFLLDLVRTRSARLLVIGLRRRSAVGKLILGSHAQRILLDADCPVLAVKP